MRRIVVDTNVFVSALNFAGWPLRALRQAEESFEICTSADLIAELERVLLTKFNWQQKEMDRFLEPLLATTCLVKPTVVITACRDPDDNRVLECAIAAGAQLIVSGDKDLLSLDVFRGIRIVTPRQFLAQELWKY